MKTLFIEAIRKMELNVEKLKELETLLPHVLYIAYSIQYKKLAEEIKKKLRNKEIIGFSQVLGCSELKTDAEAILLIGEARFHALNLAASSGKPVFVFDNHSVSMIDKKEIETIQKKEKGKFLKYLSSDNLGILVSSKPGQENLPLATKIKKELDKKGKKAHLFISDNIRTNELENFPVDLWINTACSGLAYDSPRIINWKTIKNHEK